jgi:hypothetical protein
MEDVGPPEDIARIALRLLDSFGAAGLNTSSSPPRDDVVQRGADPGPA